MSRRLVRRSTFTNIAVIPTPAMPPPKAPPMVALLTPVSPPASTLVAAKGKEISKSQCLQYLPISFCTQISTEHVRKLLKLQENVCLY